MRFATPLVTPLSPVWTGRPGQAEAGRVETERLAVPLLLGDETLGAERGEHAQNVRHRTLIGGALDRCTHPPAGRLSRGVGRHQGVSPLRTRDGQPVHPAWIQRYDRPIAITQRMIR